MSHRPIDSADGSTGESPLVWSSGASNTPMSSQQAQGQSQPGATYFGGGHFAIMCPECDELIESSNKMARHMYATKHCLPKCPLCDTYIVGRAFKASLQKVIDTEREKSTRQRTRALRDADTDAGAHGRSPNREPSSPPPERIDVASHAHLSRYPHFHVFEKDSFPRAPASGQSSGSTGATPTIGSGGCGPTAATHRSMIALPPDRKMPVELSSHSTPSTTMFRCVECLNVFATWTQMTKHLDSTEHSFAVCCTCKRSLKCFGPTRPHKHEETTGHMGFIGYFYCKNDYMVPSNGSPSVYANPDNKFTGLTQLQYRCVCGVTFVHPVLLAEHLITVHKAAFIGTGARPFFCKTCELSLTTLAALRDHVRIPAPLEAPLAAATSGTEESLLSLSSMELPLNLGQIGDGFDRRALPQYNHDVAISFFHPNMFLVHRPISYCRFDDLVAWYQSTSHLAKDNPSGAQSVAWAQPQPPHFVLFYQCRDCMYLFSSWEKCVSHLKNMGHCVTYCASCGVTVPFTDKPYANAHAHHDTDAAATTPKTPTSPADMTYREHVYLRHQVIGESATPEALEVLVDYSLAHERARVDPPLSHFKSVRGPGRGSAGASNGKMSADDPVNYTVCFQCPAEEKQCAAVFRFYGDFVDHLLETGHGDRSAAPCSPGGRKYSLLPVVEYRKRFTDEQLVTYFDFSACAYCGRPYPEVHMEMHVALCLKVR